MLCNHYAGELEIQPGEQPTRVCFTMCKNIFHNIKTDLTAKYPSKDLSQMWFVF